MWAKKAILYVCLLTGVAMALALAGQSSGQSSTTATEAPSGYDNQPNGLTDLASFNMDRGQFEQTEFIGDGLGPIFNAQSCRECHQNPVTGSTSQIKELRAGHQDAFGNFVGATATLADGTVTITNRSTPLATVSSNPSLTRRSLISHPRSVQTLAASFVERPCASPSWKPAAPSLSAALDGRTSTPRFSRSPAMPI